MRVEVFENGRWKKMSHVIVNGIDVEGLSGKFITNGCSLDLRILDDTPLSDRDKSVGDYIIKGVDGEFYPYKRDILKKTYDEV